MCFDCSPEKLVGKIVQGTGKYCFKDVRNSEDSFYIVEGVSYRDYGKVYNFTLRCFVTGFEFSINHIRRGTFYNHFKQTNEVPENVYKRIEEFMEYHQEQLNTSRKILKRIKKITLAT